MDNLIKFLIVIVLIPGVVFVIYDQYAQNKLKGLKSAEKSILNNYNFAADKKFIPRLQELWNHYVDEAVENKAKHRRFACWIIILPAMILLISSNDALITGLNIELIKDPATGVGTVLLTSNILISILSFISTIIAGLLGLFKYQEQFVQYRTNIELLKRATSLYYSGVAPYDNADTKDALFTEKIEEIANLTNTSVIGLLAEPVQVNPEPSGLTAKVFRGVDESTGVIEGTTDEMEYREESETDKDYKPATQGQTSGLKVDTVYFVRYKAISSRGIGPSKPAKVKTQSITD